MKKGLLKIAMVLMAWPMYGQIIEECPDPGTVVLSGLCANACVVCDLDGYTANNISSGQGEAPSGFCAGSLHNTQWVGFVAGSEDITLEIDVYDCEFDYDDNGILEGLQIGVYQTTDCNNFTSAFNCDDQVFDNTTGIFTNTIPLTIGGIYFLVLDGAFGDICSFTVRVTEGSTVAPEVEQVIPNIVTEPQICPGGILEVTVDPPIFGAGAYYWTLDGEAVGTDLNTEIQFPTTPGFYELCVDPYNPCSDGLQNCLMIEVVPAIVEPITETICEGTFFEFEGVEYTEADVYDIHIPVADDCDEHYELTLDVILLAEIFLEEEICVNSSFEVGEETFTETGEYSVLLVSESTGCDSIVYLDLRVVGTTEVTQLEETICYGDTYLIGGDTLTEGGNYFYDLIDIAGCDSMVDLSLEVLPAPEGMLDATICTGETYPFNGLDYSVEGIYTADIPLPTGCDSLAILNLVVLPNDTTNLNEQICAGQLYTVGMETYSTTGTFETTFPAANGCDSIVILELQVIAPVLNIDSIRICEGESYTIENDTYEEPGSYDYPYILPNGCDSTYRLVLDVVAPLTQTLNSTICANEVFSLGGETFDSTGTYTIITSAPNGCDSLYTLHLTVLDTLASSENIILCAEDTYTFADSTLNESGVYEFVLLSQEGCDSMVSINLQIAEPIVSNLDVSICSGTSFAIENEMFDSTGIYTRTLTASNGCDSVVTLTLLVEDTIVQALNVTLCEGESYSVGGNNYNETGFYEDLLSTPAGCDSIVRLDLTVISSVFTNLTESICNGDSYEVGTESYSTDGVFTDTITSVSTGCDSVVTLDLTILPINETFLEKAICANEIFTIGTETYNTTGSFTTILPSLTTGCDSIVYLDLLVHELASTQLNEQICSGDSFEMGDTSYTETGVYEANLSTTDGCDSIVILDLNVIPCNLTFASELTHNGCNGESTGAITFSITVGTAPYSYSWQSNTNGLNGSGNITANEELSSIANLPADDYTINVTDTNGIMGTLSVNVMEPPVLQLELDVLDYGGGFQLSCANASDGSISANVIGGTPPYSYSWNNGMAQASITNLAEGEYALIVNDANDCTITATNTLMAPNLVVAELEVTPPNCIDAQSGSLAVGAVSGGTEPYLYALNGSFYSPNNLFTGIALGTYIVSVQDANGCNWELETVVEPASELTVELDEYQELAFGDSLQLLATPSDPLVEYQWSGGPISSCATCANPWVAPKETTSYTVLVTDEDGCTAEDVITVFVRKQYDVYIPTAFSPDGDSFNDRFSIYGDGQLVNINSLRIYNRWGAMVYEIEDLLPGEETRGWDGYHRGQALPAGVYVYVAEIRFLDGTNEVFQGEVMLLR